MLMKSIILIPFLLLTVCLFAQSNRSNISFKEYEHNFNYIYEIDGKVEHTFHFVNKGKEAFSIIEVISECGCTVPLYTEGTLQPGDSGVVIAVFDPEEPIDKEFNKQLTVRVTNDTALIKIKGHIIPIERPTEESMFLEKIGDTWFRSSYFQFGKMTNNRVYTKTFDFYNAGIDSLILVADSLPNFLSMSITPEVIAPKSLGKIEIQYDALKKDDYGYVTDELTLKSTEDSLAIKTMFISGNIAEYFSDTLDIEKAPRAVIVSPEIVNLGTVLKNTPKEAFFTIKNEGKDTLFIRKISSPCTCIKVESLSGFEIKAGEEMVFKAIFDARGRRKGNALKFFYVYVNDSKNSILKLGIKATIK